jgi:biopolymer transport protein ExbB/TolQ
LKWTKIRLQRQALGISILPESTFVLSPNTVDQLIRNINEQVEQPKHFFLFNRIVGALSNLKNIGMISDVSDILRTYNEQDEEAVETSYSLLNGFLWAIPVLGFIGTVQGLSMAIGEFGMVLQQGGDMQALTGSLKNVTGGLATAFETTLVALVLALFLHLWATAMRKAEEELLYLCSEYCSQNIVAHLRMTFNREE